MKELTSESLKPAPPLGTTAPAVAPVDASPVEDVRVEGRKPYQRLVGSLVLALFGALSGVTVATIFDWPIIALLTSSLLGYLACAALFWFGWDFFLNYMHVKTKAMQTAITTPSVEETTEVVKDAIVEQVGTFRFDVIFWTIIGMLVGAVGGAAFFGWHGIGILGTVLSAIVSGIAFGWLTLLEEVFGTALFIVTVRKLGIFGYTLIGAVVGAGLGMEIWRRNFEIEWSLSGALWFGIPLTAIFTFVGWKNTRPPVIAKGMTQKTARDDKSSESP